MGVVDGSNWNGPQSHFGPWLFWSPKNLDPKEFGPLMKNITWIFHAGPKTFFRSKFTRAPNEIGHHISCSLVNTVNSKVVIVLCKVVWADPCGPWVVIVITQESAHATLHSTITTLIIICLSFTYRKFAIYRILKRLEIWFKNRLVIHNWPGSMLKTSSLK